MHVLLEYAGNFLLLGFSSSLQLQRSAYTIYPSFQFLTKKTDLCLHPSLLVIECWERTVWFSCFSPTGVCTLSWATLFRLQCLTRPMHCAGLTKPGAVNIAGFVVWTGEGQGASQQTKLSCLSGQRPSLARIQLLLNP